VLTFVHTSPFTKQDKQYSRSIVVPLRRPTADTALIVAAAVRGMREIFMPGLNMAKAGVHLLDIQDGDLEQHELDLDKPEIDRSTLMTALDRLNNRYGRGTVSMASGGNQGERRRWIMKRELRTPDYTTCWLSMPIARA
jgi:DNA polymerase V